MEGDINTVESISRISLHPEHRIISSMSFSSTSTSSISIRPLKTTTSTTTVKQPDENFTKKFSILNREKTYLSRISNYVSKNVTGETGSFRNKNRNMVFTTLNSENNEEYVNGSEQSENGGESAKTANHFQVNQKFVIEFGLSNF